MGLFNKGQQQVRSHTPQIEQKGPTPIEMEEKKPIVTWMDGRFSKSFYVMEAYFSSLVLVEKKETFYNKVAALEMSNFADATLSISYTTRGAVNIAITEEWLQTYVFKEMARMLNSTLHSDKKCEKVAEMYNRWAGILDPSKKITVDELKESDRRELFKKFVIMFESPNPDFIIL